MPKMSLPKLSLLDTFMLFLVRDGVGTLYQLHRVGGLSTGAVAPSLRRLKKMSFVLPGKRGNRRMVRYQLGVLAGCWLELRVSEKWDEAELQTDTESVARLVAIAEEEERLRPMAMTALTKAIAQRRKSLGRPASKPSKSQIADRYRAVVDSCESARLRAEITTLRKVMGGLKTQWGNASDSPVR